MSTPTFLNRGPINERRAFTDNAGRPRYSVTRALLALADGGKPDGFEAEAHQEYRSDGCDWCTGDLLVPWAALLEKRDLNVSRPTAGGTLVAEPAAPAVDALRPYSVATRTGMQIMSGIKPGMVFPAVQDEAAGAWLGADSVPTAAPEFTPTIGAVIGNPFMWSTIIRVSARQLRQMPRGAADDFLRRRLLLAAGRAVDRAVLMGRSLGLTAAERVSLLAQPTGIVPLAGFKVGTGPEAPTTAVANDSLPDLALGAQRYVAGIVADDSACQFVAGRFARSKLMVRTSGGNPIAAGPWVDDRLYSRPAHCTAAMEDNSIVYGPWSESTLMLFGGGVEIAVDPATHFKTGVVQLRIMIPMDCAFPLDAAFALAQL